MREEGLPMSAEQPSGSEHKSSPPLRIAVACVLGLLILGYLVAIVSGHLPPERRLDVTSLAIIGAAAIGIVLSINPRQLERLKLLEMSGFKLEMLEKVRERQSEQAVQLQDMRL